MNKRNLLENLVNELDDIVPYVDHFNINEIQGLFYALVITPMPVEPDEWIGELFYGEPPDINQKQMESLLPAAFDVYDAYVNLQESGRLTPPFDFNNLKSNEFDAVYQWCNGFLAGLLLREAFWFGEEDEKGRDPYLDMLTNSAMVFKALVTKNFAILDNLERLKAQIVKDGEEPSEDRIFAALFMTIPFALENLQNAADDFAMALDEEERPARSAKVGRNDPCPCGSGKKCKKCCLH